MVGIGGRTLLLLRATGVDRAEPAVESAMARLEAGLQWNSQGGWDVRSAEFGGNPFFEGEVEPCINGGTLALGDETRPAAGRLCRALRLLRLPSRNAPKTPLKACNSLIL